MHFAAEKLVGEVYLIRGYKNPNDDRWTSQIILVVDGDTRELKGWHSLPGSMSLREIEDFLVWCCRDGPVDMRTLLRNWEYIWHPLVEKGKIKRVQISLVE
jgi:hypothetical protein